EDGYLIATDDELMGITAPSAPEVDSAAQESLSKEVEALGIGAPAEGEVQEGANEFPAGWDGSANGIVESSAVSTATAVAPAPEAPAEVTPAPAPPAGIIYKPSFTIDDLHEALELVRLLDPPGVACRDLRECLLYQLRYIQQQHMQQRNGTGTSQV